MASGLGYRQVVAEFGERNFQGADEGSRAECTGRGPFGSKGQAVDGDGPFQEERGGREAAGEDIESRAQRAVDLRDCL